MSRTRAVTGPDTTIVALVIALGALLPIGACADDDANIGAAALPGAHPERAIEEMRNYGCGACHTIPGVRGANGKVGPPLADFGQRSFIAGAIPNSTENLVLWIVNPQAVEPGTAMPFLGVSQSDARDIAAYLHSLR